MSQSEQTHIQPEITASSGEADNGKKSVDRPRYFGRTVVAFAAGVAFGVPATFSGMALWNHNKPVEHHEVTADGGVGKVTATHLNLAEIHATGFETTVDGFRAQVAEVDRKLGITPIPLPDITTEFALDDEIIVSDLCIAGGRKDVTEQIINGVKHVDYVIDPADISVCSREKPDHFASVRNDGNWITNINQASDALNKMGKDVDTQEKNAEIEKANKLQSKMNKLLVNIAIDFVNKQCAPKVFEVTKDALLDRVEDLLGREGEVFTARYDETMGEPTISDKSDMATIIESITDSADPGTKISYEAGALGNCELAPEVATQGADNE